MTVQLQKLKSIEKSIKDIKKTEVSNSFLSTLNKELEKKKQLEYQNPMVVRSLFDGKETTRGLQIPKHIKNVKANSFEAKPFCHMNIQNYIVRNLDSFTCKFGKEALYWLECLDVSIRSPEMSKIIVKDIMDSEIVRESFKNEKCASFGFGYSYNQQPFTLDLSDLEEKDKDNILDIINNYNTYLVHPEIGRDIMIKELEESLAKYYNNYTFYLILDQENEDVFEFQYK